MSKFKMCTVLAALAISTSAMAKTPFKPPAPVPVLASCSGSDISVPGAVCAGFFEGNLNGNKPSAGQVNSALGQFGFNFSGSLPADRMLTGLTGKTIDFDDDLYGLTIVGIHYGNVTGANGVKSNNVTAFYLFNAGTTGLDSFTTKFGSLSNASLYFTGTAPCDPPVTAPVPEPETYAMMLGGLGLVGFIARRRKQKAA